MKGGFFVLLFGFIFLISYSTLLPKFKQRTELFPLCRNKDMGKKQPYGHFVIFTLYMNV